MASKTEYVLASDGSFSKRVIQEIELEITDAIMQAVAGDVTRTTLNVFALDGCGPIHLSMGTSVGFITINLPTIPIKAPYTTAGGGILVPNFAGGTPILSLVWKVPTGMRVRLMFQFERLAVLDTWLFACDNENRTFRLPLANLHEDCRVCMGHNPVTAANVMQLAAKELETFASAQFNTDLWGDVESTQRMFQFKPRNEKKDSWETLPVQADNWTNLCKQVSTEVAANLIQI